MLRHSTSITQSTKRSTRLVGRIASQQIDPRHLDSLREVSETLTDSTPTDAMRRLQGKDTPARPGSLLDKQITAQSTRERDAIRLLLDEMDRNLDRRESAISRLRQEVSLTLVTADSRHSRKDQQSVASVRFRIRARVIHHLHVYIQQYWFSYFVYLGYHTLISIAPRLDSLSDRKLSRGQS